MFLQGTKLFITKLKQEECLKFNEYAFHGTSTHKLEKKEGKKNQTSNWNLDLIKIGFK